MSKQAVLSQTVAPVTQRRLEIEKTALPPNLGAFLDNLVEEVPDSVALHLIESGEALTYAELRARVNQVANGLRHLGVRKGAHIGVMLPNIKEFPIAWLAIAKVGAVMVPINIRYTSRELHYVLDDSEADYLIILADLLPLFEEVANTLPRLPRNNVMSAARARMVMENGTILPNLGSNLPPKSRSGQMISSISNIPRAPRVFPKAVCFRMIIGSS